MRSSRSELEDDGNINLRIKLLPQRRRRWIGLDNHPDNARHNWGGLISLTSKGSQSWSCFAQWRRIQETKTRNINVHSIMRRRQRPLTWKEDKSKTLDRTMTKTPHARLGRPKLDDQPQNGVPPMLAASGGTLVLFRGKGGRVGLVGIRKQLWFLWI